LTSSVLVWPDATRVDRAIRQWAADAARQRPEVTRIGYFGSYARGDWGVGSDLDVVIVVTGTPTPFIRRAAEWDLSALPVPADLLVYTAAEWQALPAQSPRLARTLAAATVWVFDGVPPRPTTSKAAV
jgi:predicted nucleotidyltransferase